MGWIDEFKDQVANIVVVAVVHNVIYIHEKNRENEKQHKNNDNNNNN